MKHMNYSSITAMLRRIHRASSISDDTGIPVKELMERDRELRKKLQQERELASQRRDFLRAAGGLGLGAGMMAVTPGALAAAGGGGSQPSIAIVGGGSGGLRTAHRLMQYGISSTVYEANDRVGGRMYSDRTFFNDNRVVEYGGEFISTEHTAIRNLAHQLGLKLEDANKLSVGEEETYLINDQLYSESDLMDEWAGGLYETMKRAQQEAPWQPFYNAYNAKHYEYDWKDAIDWMELDLGYSRSHWVHKLLLTDLVAEYGITEGNSALNLIYLLAWNTHNSGGLPLAGTDERLHVVGGNDLIPLTMAAQLPAGSVIPDKKLTQIHGAYGGPYTLHFADASIVNCDVLVLSLPMNLIKELDYIAPDIWNGFSPQKQDAFLSDSNVSDNGKIMLEFTDRHWDMTQVISGVPVHQAARAYSDPDKFISTWEGEPGNPSPLGVMVDYNGGYEARHLQSKNLHGQAHKKDAERFLLQAENIWPGISAKYTGKALVSNWLDDPLARSAFTSPSVGTMTSWWGAQWETEGNIFFAGEAYDEEYWSYMNGAILSAERVAREIQQKF
ncbi:MAG: FAD-dependent oxidoreductase [Gammaproteobacteria bacterium]|jgi:monoamine oxidase|nr:FAD-dependent oxidoreductase [Gammaproteobacteria bacterium]